MPLQPYILHVQPAIRSLDIEVSTTTIKTGQTIQFSITLEPTLDLTILFDCGTSSTPLQIIHIQQTFDLSPILIGNCTYSSPGQYHPLINAMNRINSVNQTIRIDVEPPLSVFKVEIEDRLEVNQHSLVTIRALEQISFEGMFTLTIIDSANEKNQTKTERVQLFQSNNFTEQIYMNITTYGKQILHVRGGDYPTIREAQVTFTIGADLTQNPQVYLINQIGFVNEDFIWIDIQWIDGIGFDIKINYGNENKVLIRYGQFISNPFNRTIKKNDGLQWKRIAKQRLQIGYKYDLFF
jgi:hypothetical protein